MDVDLSDSNLPTHQLHALFTLHSDLNVNKTLINMQLAATHIAFVVQELTKEPVCHFNASSLFYTEIYNYFYRSFLIFLEHYKKSRILFQGR